MKCPTCSDATLVMSDRQGIEIDYCPQCRGVWLDRGELDKLIDRSASMPAVAQDARRANRDGADHHRSRYTSERHEYADKRKKSWLNELFD